MIRGAAEKVIWKRNKWEIGLWDDKSETVYTFEITGHQNIKDSDMMPRTEIPEDFLPVLKGLSEALIQMELMPRDAVGAELGATKYHLEDLRKLLKI